ncbi:MAG: tetratricopeptide repeat protein [Bacteroidota bacterium]
MKYGILFLSFFLLCACQSSDPQETTNEETVELEPQLEAITLLGDSLSSALPEAGKALDNYKAAKGEYDANPDDPEVIIWYGRRTAYLGHFRKAIDIYTEGIEKHPEDARFYRHRGHRYISTRQYEKAIVDFEKAATLIEGQADQTEPDGLPNDRNIPLSTLHGNIWYHLGLAYYLQNDMSKALEAFGNRTVTHRYDDNIVSGGHWLYMINRRLGQADAAESIIAPVHGEMDIIENGSYYQMCRFYQGAISREDLQPAGKSSSSDDVLRYGLGNWHLYHEQDTAAARAQYRLLLDEGNPYSFAYLAAEADWNRLFK